MNTAGTQLSNFMDETLHLAKNKLYGNGIILTGIYYILSLLYYLTLFPLEVIFYRLCWSCFVKGDCYWFSDNFNKYSEKINEFLGNTWIMQLIDNLFTREILYDEFTDNAVYVQHLFKFIYFMVIYIFTLIVLNLKHTEVVGFGFVSLVNIVAFFFLSTDVSKFMGSTFISPFLFVYFPWLVLSACSGLILYVVGQLKWAYGRRNSTIQLLKDEEKTMKRMREVFTAVTVMTFCLSALFMFNRSSPFVRIFMIPLMISILCLDIVLLVDTVKLFRKEIRNLYIPTEYGPGVQSMDAVSQMYNVFKNINMNFMLNYNTDLHL